MQAGSTWWKWRAYIANGKGGYRTVFVAATADTERSGISVADDKERSGFPVAADKERSGIPVAAGGDPKRSGTEVAGGGDGQGRSRTAVAAAGREFAGGQGRSGTTIATGSEGCDGRTEAATGEGWGRKVGTADAPSFAGLPYHWLNPSVLRYIYKEKCLSKKV